MKLVIHFLEHAPAGLGGIREIEVPLAAPRSPNCRYPCAFTLVPTVPGEKSSSCSHTLVVGLTDNLLLGTDTESADDYP